MRLIGGIALGLAIALLATQSVDGFVGKFRPRRMDSNNPQAMKAFVATLPRELFMMVLFLTASGTFVATTFAGRVAYTPLAAYIVGIILFVVALVRSIGSPMPRWFTLASLGIYVIAPVAGARASRRTA